MQQMDQIRVFTKQHTMFIYGLLLALFGFIMALGGIIDTLWIRWFYWSLFPTQASQDSPQANLAIGIVTLLPSAMYLVGIVLAIWYVRRYGQVKNNKVENYRPLIEGVVGYTIYFVAELTAQRMHLPACLSLIALAIILIAHWWLFARKQLYYPALAVIAILISIVPVINANVYHWLYFYVAPDWYQHNVDIPAGIILCIAGILDFQYMRRMLQRVRQSITTTTLTTATS
jgi:hypothetical protein